MDTRESQSKTLAPLASLMVCDLTSQLLRTLEQLMSSPFLPYYPFYLDKKELESERNGKLRPAWLGPKVCVKEEREFYSRLIVWHIS